MKKLLLEDSFVPNIPPPSLLKLENGQLVTPTGVRFDIPRCGRNIGKMNMEESCYNQLDRNGKLTQSNDHPRLVQPNSSSDEAPRINMWMYTHRQTGIGPRQEKFTEEVALSKNDVMKIVSTKTQIDVKPKSVKDRNERNERVRSLNHHRFVEYLKHSTHKKVKPLKHPQGCLFCKDKEHSAQHCHVYPEVDSRIEFLNKNQLCHHCVFPGHDAQNCPTFHRKSVCRYCKGRHILAICKSSTIPANTSQHSSTESSSTLQDATIKRMD
ncbi:hypothetical protein GCK72_014344 [Caenorhabditis remanei]|uniref:CCHC-type domain-containing protein n=2 Tax=Caenorhabditis remanei TaxID=31234 RepID=A0A6A5GRS8_CAERE|nr:hypothetical protein GCK72_014344 [Caenorhabditis remanei]KAF1757887.1 hypothetical protein GCK72_014344 [Caenorhabditis remanei]